MIYDWLLEYVEQEKIRDERSIGMRTPQYIWRDLGSGYETMRAPTAADALTMWRANTETVDARRYETRTAHETPKRRRFVRVKLVEDDASSTSR